ncbi:MAG: hypothetical protein EA411_03805 [Saprospirales bacterium]|nr:MAG: hypothetical protein EA411_03805 [Saprospirales bacterium]
MYLCIFYNRWDESSSGCFGFDKIRQKMMKNFIVPVLALSFIATLLFSCGVETQGDWFKGHFYGSTDERNDKSRVFFSVNDAGTVDLYDLHRGISLNHYLGEWEVANDTIILRLNTRTGDGIEEMKVVHSDREGIKIIGSNMYEDVSLTRHHLPAVEEDETEEMREFLNILFLVENIAGESIEIESDQDPVFIYFERGNQDFIIARAFFGCQLSSSSIAPRQDGIYQLYPFPSVRDSACPQLSTETSAREAYRTADNFHWENGLFHLRSGEEIVMTLQAVGPVKN